MDRVLLSSESPHYATPVDLWEKLNAEFRFDFDPCPYNENFVGPLFNFDGLRESWAGKRVYCNPPYGKAIPKFLEKAMEADVAVFLIPARVDTRWFHEICLPLAREIRFLKGRLKFQNCENPAPFPCMLVIFEQRHPRASTDRGEAMAKRKWKLRVGVKVAKKARELAITEGRVIVPLTPVTSEPTPAQEPMLWHEAQGNPPPPVGDCRKLVWLVDADDMGWIGIRAWNGSEGYWMTNGRREESGNVTHWMNLPERPGVRRSDPRCQVK